MNRPATDEVRLLDTLREVSAAQWDALVDDNPFLKHAFLHALHETGCASARTGWAPRYITLWYASSLVAAMPLYLKSHSYGEYIFDWAWANAYHRHGFRYYPKLVCTVPFTPVTGPRLLSSTDLRRRQLLQEAMRLAHELEVSSLHVLYSPQQQVQEMREAAMLLRDSVQFHWHNPGYRNFADFLAQMNQQKRKKINQERRKLNEHGISFRCLLGPDITESDWRFFTRCYLKTYRDHHSSPYLSLDFFCRIGQAMPQHIVLVMALQNGRPVAAALNLYNRERLFGRYWGSIAYIPGLHFETCYYQAIEFCIERGLNVFEGGVQGEHKISRGLMPVATYSSHWLAHPQFASAIADYLELESRGVRQYMQQLEASSPFKAPREEIATKKNCSSIS